MVKIYYEERGNGILIFTKKINIYASFENRINIFKNDVGIRKDIKNYIKI